MIPPPPSLAACDVSQLTSDYTTCATRALSDTSKQCICLKQFISGYGACGGAYTTACQSALDTYKQSNSACDWSGVSCLGMPNPCCLQPPSHGTAQPITWSSITENRASHIMANGNSKSVCGRLESTSHINNPAVPWQAVNTPHHRTPTAAHGAVTAPGPTSLRTIMPRGNPMRNTQGSAIQGHSSAGAIPD